ncbi:MAG: type VI secretion system-associated FHA domain protein TagH, partial [Caulobacteraceae bacterium]|nr:type VI secretion system-associated FHA domain protein TagH [Caulobacter sp.]
RPRAPDPFAGALAADPLGDRPDDPFAAPAKGDRIAADPILPNGDDAWSRRRDPRAGDWDTPSRRDPPEAMIGSDPAWREPEPSKAEGGGFGFDAPFTRPVLQAAPVAPDDLAIPSDWDAPAARAAAPSEAAAPVAPLRAEAPPREPAHPAPAEALPSRAAAGPDDADLLRAFCTGARLDPAAFAGADAAETMERLGAVYRRMVLGLGDVMGERTALKSEYRMVRTVVRAADNNPFKWAPPQRVATELLRPPEEGFLGGPEAVAESFADVKKHLLCMLAGLRAALASTLDLLAPARVEEAAGEQPFTLKTRAAVLWGEYGRLYAQVRSETQDSADSTANREFRAAYEAQLAELDRMSDR